MPRHGRLFCFHAEGFPAARQRLTRPRRLETCSTCQLTYLRMSSLFNKRGPTSPSAHLPFLIPVRLRSGLPPTAGEPISCSLPVKGETFLMAVPANRKCSAGVRSTKTGSIRHSPADGKEVFISTVPDEKKSMYISLAPMRLEVGVYVSSVGKFEIRWSQS